jgi:hypothetical protein
MNLNSIIFSEKWPKPWVAQFMDNDWVF